MKTGELGIIDLVEFQENSGNRRKKMGVNSDYAIEVVEFIQCVILAVAELLYRLFCRADNNFAGVSNRPVGDIGKFGIGGADSG